MEVLTSRYVLCYLFFSAAVVWTQENPPEYVLRADTRKPKDVFLNGFPPLGTNQDLLQHLSGVSCAKDTALVDTTSSEDFAFEWGKMLAKWWWSLLRV